MDNTIVEELDVFIPAMNAAARVDGVRKCLAPLHGVFSVHTDLSSQRARIRYDSTRIAEMDILRALSQAGYLVVK